MVGLLSNNLYIFCCSLCCAAAVCTVPTSRAKYFLGAAVSCTHTPQQFCTYHQSSSRIQCTYQHSLFYLTEIVSIEMGICCSRHAKFVPNFEYPGQGRYILIILSIYLCVADVHALLLLWWKPISTTWPFNAFKLINCWFTDQQVYDILLNDLQLSDKQVDLLYHYYCRIDTDMSGEVNNSFIDFDDNDSIFHNMKNVPLVSNTSLQIDMKEMFQYFHLEDHSLHRKLFSYFDEDESGHLNFAEFACTLWNFLTAKSLGLIFFNMVCK